ncbi:MAG: class I SAM-dependent methyltransferase [Bacteroidota bacterium]
MRLHLFEWEDFSWYPDLIREAQTDYLRFLMETFDVFRAVIPKLGEAMERAGTSHLVDFCSGGGGSMLLVQRHLKKQFPGLNFSAQLSDLYPNLPAFQHVATQSQDKISFTTQPTDVREIPEDFNEGFWTIFNGFHHLKPDAASDFLQEAVRRKRPVGIFEPLDKSILQLVLNTFVLTILMFLVTPFIRPFRWSRLVFTYLLPLIPFFTLWDGWVSVLRLYMPARMQEMVASLEGSQGYDWEIGKARHQFGTVIYLIGVPK